MIMKSIIGKIGILVCIALSLGCETDPIIFNGPYHVRFTNATRTEKESYSRTIMLEVHVAGPAPNEAITIDYTIGGDARENIDYLILGNRGKVVIKKGEYFGNIELKLINNSNNIIRSQDIIFTLSGVNNSEFRVGQSKGGIGKSFTLTIVDDCILGGYYTGTRSAFQIPVKDITITSQDCENYRLSNWNIDIIDWPFDLGLNFTDNGDNTLTIPLQDENLKIHGIGAVNPSTREIVMTLTFVDFDNEEISFTLKPE